MLCRRSATEPTMLLTWCVTSFRIVCCAYCSAPTMPDTSVFLRTLNSRLALPLIAVPMPTGASITARVVPIVNHAAVFPARRAVVHRDGAGARPQPCEPGSRP
jgi:hypothetical protein